MGRQRDSLGVVIALMRRILSDDKSSKRRVRYFEESELLCILGNEFYQTYQSRLYWTLQEADVIGFHVSDSAWEHFTEDDIKNLFCDKTLLITAREEERIPDVLKNLTHVNGPVSCNFAD